MSQIEQISAKKPRNFVVWRPYQPAYIPDARLQTPANRLQSLIRAGRLYLTAQDAIALALENNIDLEIQRYNPLRADIQIQRQQAGGVLRGVTTGTTQVGRVASGQCVSGSQAAAGVNTGGNSGQSTNGANLNASITQVGPVTQILDPNLQASAFYSHQSQPQFNSVQSQTTNLIQNTRNYNLTYQQGYLTGGQATASLSESYCLENAPSSVLNPTVAPVLNIQYQQNFLNSFGVAVNSRFINAAKFSRDQSVLQFKAQLISIVASTLNLYWGLVSNYEDQRAKEGALKVSQQLLNDSRRQVEIGTLAPISVTQAEAEVATRQQDLIVSETTLLQQQVNLKNQISRNGLANRALENVDIVPIDTIRVPDQEDLGPLSDLVTEARKADATLASTQIGVQSAKVSALGTANGVLPSLGGVASASAAGLAGQRNPLLSADNGAPNPYFIGNIGNAFGQVFRRNFPSQRATAYFNANLRNRLAQSDYGIEQLQLKRTELSAQRDINAITVTVSNQFIGLQQARARFKSAASQRNLQEQLYDAEQKKFKLGVSTTYLVIQLQRDLANAQSAEVAARSTYIQAKTSLDQGLGRTLQTNNVMIDEAREGVVARPSGVPNDLPQMKTVPTPKQ